MSRTAAALSPVLGGEGLGVRALLCVSRNAKQRPQSHLPAGEEQGGIQKPPSRLADAFQVMTLAGFALAQPLYELLGRNAAFFVFHHTQPLDLLLLVFFLSVLLPGFVAGLVVFLPGQRRTIPGLLALLAGLALTPILGRVQALPALAVVGLALLGGVGLSWSRWRYRIVRSFLLALTPAFIVFPALFLSGAQVARLLHGKKPVAVAAPEVKKPAPVVMVILDELPLSSLLNERREIDTLRYPNFAALAREAHWYRNATTVHSWTTEAVPALLTGKYTQAGQLPTAEDHPQSLFTLLGSSHELRVLESTSLCPSSLNVCKRQPAFRQRMTSLLRDLLLVEMHLVLPRAWTQKLPPVDTDWCQFGETRQSFLDRPRQFREFLETLTPTENRPGLYFLHIPLPHMPYSFLPSGKGYGRDAFTVGLGQKKEWTQDEDIVTHAHQRHLLQVGYVDRLIGELLARLKETGLYDDCVLIVTADHGCSFMSGGHHRFLDAKNRADILRVPLFLKTPGQKMGQVSDRNVQHVDVVPTIADVLGVQMPWPVDGRSALGSTELEWGTKRVLVNGEQHEFGPRLDDDFGQLGRQLELFGSGSWGSLYRHGPHGTLVGRKVEELRQAGSASITGRLQDPGIFGTVSPGSTFVPARIQGILESKDSRTVPLAVAVNGVVQAVTRTQAESGRETVWAVMVPEDAFTAGNNQIAVYEIVGDGTLRLVTRSETGHETLSYRLEGKRLIGEDGSRLEVRKHAFEGYLDVFHVDQACVTFAGWSADPRGGSLPERIVMLADGEPFHSGALSAERRDVAKMWGDERYRWSGFNFCIPRERFTGKEGAQFRFFAVSKDGKASELRYQGWYERRGLRPLR